MKYSVEKLLVNYCFCSVLKVTLRSLGIIRVLLGKGQITLISSTLCSLLERPTLKAFFLTNGFSASAVLRILNVLFLCKAKSIDSTFYHTCWNSFLRITVQERFLCQRSSTFQTLSLFNWVAQFKVGLPEFHLHCPIISWDYPILKGSSPFA